MTEPPVPEFDASLLDARTQRRQNILREMEKAEKEVPLWQAPAVAAGVEAQPPSSGQAVRRPKAPRKPALARQDDARPEPADAIREQYEALFGPARDVRAASIKSQMHHEPAENGSHPGRRDARGVVLRARLVTTVASAPVSAAVIAALTQGQRLGSRLLPLGTEFHGEVRGGGDSARVYVDFTYARLPDGSTIDLDAVATDRSGRQGIPGTRPVTGRTAGSVGLSGGQALARSAASAVPGVAGIFASGAAAMADAASEKAQRLDRDEVIAQADVNTLISIYVRQAGGDQRGS